MIRSIRKITPHKLLLVVIVLKIVVGTLYVTQQPLWQYHEADFLRVVRYLRDEGKLPVLAADAEPDRTNNSQPPLYYYSLLPFVTAMDDNQVTPPGVNPMAVCDGLNSNLTTLVTTAAYDDPLHGTVALGYTLRLVSLITSLVAVIFTYLAGRVLFPAKPYLTVLAAALVAFEPTSIIVASEINNDNLILALGAVHLWVCARLIQNKGSKIGNLVAVMVVAGVALLAKISGWMMLAISGVLIVVAFIQLMRQRTSRRQKQILFGSAGVFVLAVVGIVTFNVAQYGSVFGRYRGLEKIVVSTLENLTPGHVVNMTVATLQDTFADYLNPLRTLQPRVSVLAAYGGLLVIGIIAAVWGIITTIRTRLKGEVASLALVVGYSLAMIGLVIFRSILNNGIPDLVNIMTIISPVRYYAPALPALALICSVGFVSIRYRQLSTIGMLVGSGIAVCWLSVSALGLSTFIGMNQLRANSVLSAEAFEGLQGITRVDSAQDGSLPQVVGYQVQTQAASGIVNLDLYVRAQQSLDSNYVLETHLSNGMVTTTCRVVPVRGLYPTARWKVNEVVVIHSQIPNCIAPQTAPIDVDVQWLKYQNVDRRIASTEAAGIPLKLTTLAESIGVATTCPVNKGIIGGGLQLLKYNAPATVMVGAGATYYLPSVNWLVRFVPTDAAIRTYRLIHNDSGKTYQCQGVPRQETYPFKDWSAGETVYFDECGMKIKPDAPKGTYTVSVGIKTKDGTLLQAVDSTGAAIQSGYVDIGTLDVR